MRIDKYLSNLWFCSRKELKKYIKNDIVFVNWELITSWEYKINLWDEIQIWEYKLEYIEDIYIMLNKPKNYISSNIDEAWYKSCKALLEWCPYDEIVEIMWRLDVDTTWLILMTNKWKVIHNVINSKKDIFKKYIVETKELIDEKSIEKLEKWLKIDDYITKPAKVKKINDYKIELSISEWKFHQVKKMLIAVKNEVVNLHRVSIWEINIWDLKEWEWRYLNKNEINYLENV